MLLERKKERKIESKRESKKREERGRTSLFSSCLLFKSWELEERDDHEMRVKEGKKKDGKKLEERKNIYENGEKKI